MASGGLELGPIALALKHPWIFYSRGLALFFVAAVAWWQLTNRLKSHSARKALRTDLSLFYTGAVVALGIIGAVVQFQSNIERDQRQQRLALSSENAKRFDIVVAQLQKASDSARLGALYSLAELSRQDGFYWPSIVQLTAYLRHVAQGSTTNPAEMHHLLYLLSERDEGHWEYRFSEPFPLDLSFLNLKDLKLSGAKLYGMNFRNTDFSGSILPGADLAHSDLACANFENANFYPGYLHATTGAAKLGPKLSFANFRNAWLDGVEFKEGVDVEGACFEGARLQGADISGFDLKKARGLRKSQIESSKGNPRAPADFEELSCSPVKECGTR